MNVPSVGFDSKIFELRFFEIAVKVLQRRKKCE